MKLYIGLCLACSIMVTSSWSVMDVGYWADNETLALHGSGSSLSTNDIYIGYRGNTNRVEIGGGAVLQSATTYIGWTSYDGYFGDSIPAIRNRVGVSGGGSSWQGAVIHTGFGPNAAYNRLDVSQGGQVDANAVFAGFYGGHSNQILVRNGGSKLVVNGTDPYGSFVIGHQSGGNSMIVSDGATVDSASAVIGFGEVIYDSTNNFVKITGAGSVWNSGTKLIIGSGVKAKNNELKITDGGTVISTRVIFGESGAENNSALITGAGSEWVINNNLFLDGSYDTLPSSIRVEDGGKLIINGRLYMNFTEDNQYTSNLDLGNGGTLDIATAFDASTDGFNFGSGGTLKVAGQLSNLFELKQGRTLVATNVFGNLLVNGTFFLADKTTVDGDLTLGMDGTLQFVLSSTERTLLAVTGTTDLSGKLSILLDDADALSYGTQIQLFDFAGGVTGNFDEVTASLITGGLYLDTSALNSTGNITVIPEPATSGLMLLSGLVVYLSRIRQECHSGFQLVLRFRRSKKHIVIAETW